MTAPSAVYVLPDKMGGAFTSTANLIEHRPARMFGAHLVLTHNTSSREPRTCNLPAADSRHLVEHSLPRENLWAVIRRIARAVPSGPGVIVTADLLDVAATSVHDFGRAVIMLVHGSDDYYFDLAARHESTTHAFIACSEYIAERLRRRLPHRCDAIHHIPHGVPPTPFIRRTVDGPLRAAFIGRVDVHKGVLALPRIDDSARARGASVRWTVIGDGPLAGRLREEWRGGDVRYLGPLTREQTLAALAEQDVLVLPTRREGFSIALLEAMNAGVVPIVSDLASGIPEVVRSHSNGFRVPADAPSAFADCLLALDRDRGLLEACSAQARDTIATGFTIERSVRRHYDLYARYEDLYRPLAGGVRLSYGSRLDQPWIPNTIVRAIRHVSSKSVA